MSQSAVVASRREIRRAFGSEAASTLDDHQKAIEALGAGLYKTQNDMTALLKDHALQKQSTAQFQARSFRDRLRWLLTGR